MVVAGLGWAQDTCGLVNSSPSIFQFYIEI